MDNIQIKHNTKPKQSSNFLLKDKKKRYTQYNPITTTQNPTQLDITKQNTPKLITTTASEQNHHKFSAEINSTTDVFSDKDSDKEDILNEKVSDKTKLKAMEKATSIIGTHRKKLNRKTFPSSKDSWLLYTIRTIITSTNKIIFPHKYKFENTRNNTKYNTDILKRSKYDFTRALAEEDGTIL